MLQRPSWQQQQLQYQSKSKSKSTTTQYLSMTHSEVGTVLGHTSSVLYSIIQATLCVLYAVFLSNEINHQSIRPSWLFTIWSRDANKNRWSRGHKLCDRDNQNRRKIINNKMKTDSSRWRNETLPGVCVSWCVCVLRIKPLILPFDIQHTTPVRADSSNPRETHDTRSVVTKYDTAVVPEYCTRVRKGAYKPNKKIRTTFMTCVFVFFSTHPVCVLIIYPTTQLSVIQQYS